MEPRQRGRGRPAETRPTAPVTETLQLPVPRVDRTDRNGVRRDADRWSTFE